MPGLSRCPQSSGAISLRQVRPTRTSDARGRGEAAAGEGARELEVPGGVMILRKADDLDSWYFLQLRSDPVAARNSRKPVPTKEEHDRWWRSADETRYVMYGTFFVGEKEVAA